MSRNKQKHKQEKKRRHDRQIAEGIRQAKPRIKKDMRWGPMRRRVKLSEIDREIVRKVLDAVKTLKLYP